MNTQEFLKSQRHVDTPFGKIAYFEKGSGPAALFVHGLPLCGYQWREVIDDLADQRRCIAVDLMGLGQSDVSEKQDVTYASQAKMLAAFLDALKIDRVDVVANDTGAGISQIFAATNPSRIRTLTLLNCEAHDRWPNALLTGFYASAVAGEVTEGMRAMLTDTKLAQDALGALIYEDPETFSTENVKLYLTPLVSSEKRVAQFKALADWQTCREQIMGVAEKLKASKIPAQIIWGDGDVVFDTEPSLAWFRENLGGLRQITVIPNGKLFFAEERPRQVASLVSQFWKTDA